MRRWIPASAPVADVGRPSARPPERPDGAPAVPLLEGIDVPETLRRLGLDFDSLRRLLVRFADRQGPALEALRAAVAAGDSGAAAWHAHTMAGAAGNLGAGALQVAAMALEHAARGGRTDLAALLAALEGQAAVAFRSIETVRREREPVPTEAARSFDASAARAARERLHVALGDSDLSTASEALADLTRVGLPAPAGADLPRLRDRVEGYKYAEAQVIATRLLERLGETGP